MSKIAPVLDETRIPEGQECQEASTWSVKFYVPCGMPAVAIVHHPKDRRSYYMCDACADHNIRNRGGVLRLYDNPAHRPVARFEASSRAVGRREL